MGLGALGGAQKVSACRANRKPAALHLRKTAGAFYASWQILHKKFSVPLQAPPCRSVSGVI